MSAWTNEDLQELMAYAAERRIRFVGLSRGATRLELHLDRADSLQADKTEELAPVRAFLPGVFRKLTHQALAPGMDVTPQTRLGWLDAGDLTFEIMAGQTGRLARFDVGEGATVGYGTPIAGVSISSGASHGHEND